MRSRAEQAARRLPRRRAALRAVLLALASSLLAACVSAPASRTAAPAPESAPSTARAEARERAGGAASEAPAPAAADDAASAAPPSALDAVLAERRRGDYPEIAVDETGFTITEQVRVDGDARSDYEQAVALLRQERYAEGIRLLVGVTEMSPGLTAPYVDLGIAYGRSGDFERAEAALASARRLSPDHPIVHNELGILYRKMGRFDEARASYEQALAVYSDFHFARRNLAVLCDLYLADLECALEHYTAYLESAGEDSEVEIWVADLRNRLGL